MTTVFSSKQLHRAPLPIALTHFGMVMLRRSDSSKQCSPIILNSFGSYMDLSCSQLLNAKSPMTLSELGSTTSFTPDA